MMDFDLDCDESQLMHLNLDAAAASVENARPAIEYHFVEEQNLGLQVAEQIVLVQLPIPIVTKANLEMSQAVAENMQQDGPANGQIPPTDNAAQPGEQAAGIQVQPAGAPPVNAAAAAQAEAIQVHQVEAPPVNAAAAAQAEAIQVHQVEAPPVNAAVAAQAGVQAAAVPQDDGNRGARHQRGGRGRPRRSYQQEQVNMSNFLRLLANPGTPYPRGRRPGTGGRGGRGENPGGDGGEGPAPA